MPDAKRVNRGGENLLKSNGPKTGVTLVEMLVSILILVILMLIIFQIIQLVSQAWKSSAQGTGAMQQARVAFERMTRNLSQATLNTYYSYYYASSGAPPSYYLRQSELEFISGNGPVNLPSFISSGSGNGNAKQITHAVFFQAPLGVVSTANASTYGNMPNLLNACGYFVIYCQDTLRPTLFTSPPTGLTVPQNEYRYRLMEYLQPSDNLNIYTSGAIPAGGGSVPPWISLGLPPDLTTSPPPSPISVRPLANNIIALVVMPEQFASGTTLGSEQNTTSISTQTSSYNYDSAYQATTLTAGKQLQTANQLPPLVKVIMVAIDETSAIKLAAVNLGASATSPPNLGQSSLFTDPSKLFTTGGTEGDLDKFQDVLNALPGNVAGNNLKLNYYIFQTDVIIRGAKWTSQ